MTRLLLLFAVAGVLMAPAAAEAGVHAKVTKRAAATFARGPVAVDLGSAMTTADWEPGVTITVSQNVTTAICKKPQRNAVKCVVQVLGNATFADPSTAPTPGLADYGYECDMSTKIGYGLKYKYPGNPLSWKLLAKIYCHYLE